MIKKNYKNNSKTYRKEGFIYVLVSPTTKYIKIGGTDYPPLKRIKEINSTEPYKSLGPWTLSDFRQVKDWRKMEHHLHYTFRSKLVKDIKKQKELFDVAPHNISIELNTLDDSKTIGTPKVNRMFQDENFCKYLTKLFKLAGLMNWLDIQGAWTLVLFPSTNNGRYFTLNIGRHEVAFSTLKRKMGLSTNMILLDKLILDFDIVKNWVKKRGGSIEKDVYETALPRSVSIMFEGDFADMLEFLKLEGVRRALIAYWIESLMILKERGVLSPYAKWHNYNAVAELNKEIRSMKD